MRLERDNSFSFKIWLSENYRITIDTKFIFLNTYTSIRQTHLNINANTNYPFVISTFAEGLIYTESCNLYFRLESI